jgi:hypothetical protein
VAHPWLDEGPQSHGDRFSGRRFCDSADQSFVEGADDGPVGIVRIDAERAVTDVDSHRVVSHPYRGGSEGKTFEHIKDLVGRLLKRRVPIRRRHISTPPGSFRLGDGCGSLTIGVSQEGDEAGHEESEFRIAPEEGLTEPVTLGRSSSAGWGSRFLFEDPGFEQPFEVGSDGRVVHAEQASQLGNLTRSLFQGLDNRQPGDVTEEPVALGPHRAGQPPPSRGRFLPANVRAGLVSSAPRARAPAHSRLGAEMLAIYRLSGRTRVYTIRLLSLVVPPMVPDGAVVTAS